MKLTIIGTSNAGKTYFSKLLEKKKNFVRYGCDELIAERLGLELKSLGYSGINMVSKWMGQPFDEKYKKNSDFYLKAEKEVILEALDFIKSEENKDRDVLIDTTGSVIYLGDEIMSMLRKETTIVYLKIPPNGEKELIKRYFFNPHPVIWGEMYEKSNDEDDLAALHRCFPDLLSFRAGQYSRYSDIVIDTTKLFSPKFDMDQVYEVLNKTPQVFD